MGYVYVEDFKYGIDRRRPRFAGVPGTLWDAVNVVISRGGDIERSKKFVPVYTGLEDTFGLVELDGLNYVFGSDDLAASMPNGVEYQRLQAPNTPAMIRILDAKTFDNKIYAIAEYDDGNRYHFYDGTRVSDWDTVAGALASARLTYSVLADLLNSDPAVSARATATGVLLTSTTPGTAFTIAATYVDGGGTDDQTATVSTPVANVAAVDPVEATASFTITGGTFDPNVNTVSSIRVGATVPASVELLAGPVSYVLSEPATATAIASAINENTSAHGYSAAAVDSTVTITAIEGSGTAPNAYTAFITTTGDLTTSGDAAFNGGTAAVAAVAQVSTVVFGGTFEAEDTITVTINGTGYKITPLAAATGDRVYVAHNRVWTTAGPGLYYSALNDPTDWTTVTPAATDPGVVVVSTDSDGAQRLTGVETYQRSTAVFAENAVMIYALGTDPDAFERIQELPNTGTVAGRGVRAYGANDLFYLDTMGIRSLQARDSSNAAFIDDAGTVFDPYVQERVALATQAQVRNARSVIDPRTGAYWLALGSEIFVYSNYRRTGIQGWTRIEPGFEVESFARTNDTLLVRDDDTIYVYGGVSGTEYPAANESIATVKLPFSTARDDAGFKQMQGFDFGATNEWAVTALLNPNDETETTSVGIMSGVTYPKENFEQIGETTHVAYEFSCSAAGFASLSNLAHHFAGSMRR